MELCRDAGMQAVPKQGWPWQPGPAARAQLSLTQIAGTPTASRGKPVTAEAVYELGCSAISIPAAHRHVSPWYLHASEAAAETGER